MYWWWLYTDVHRAGWLSWRCPTKLSLGHVGMIIYMQCVTSCVIDVVNAWTPGMCKNLGHVIFSKMQKMGFPWIELLPPGGSHWSLLKFTEVAELRKWNDSDAALTNRYCRHATFSTALGNRRSWRSYLAQKQCFSLGDDINVLFQSVKLGLFASFAWKNPDQLAFQDGFTSEMIE